MSDHDRDRDDLVADVVDGLTLNQEVEWDRCERLATPANRPALENLRALSGVLAGGRPGAGDAWPSWAATWRGIVCRSRTPGPVEPPAPGSADREAPGGRTTDRHSARVERHVRDLQAVGAAAQGEAGA